MNMRDKSTARLIEIIETREYFQNEVVKAAKIEFNSRINKPEIISI